MPNDTEPQARSSCHLLCFSVVIRRQSSISGAAHWCMQQTDDRTMRRRAGLRIEGGEAVRASTSRSGLRARHSGSTVKCAKAASTCRRCLACPLCPILAACMSPGCQLECAAVFRYQALIDAEGGNLLPRQTSFHSTAQQCTVIASARIGHDDCGIDTIL